MERDLKNHSLKRSVLRFGQAVGAFALADHLSRMSPKILMYHRFARRSEGRRVGADQLEAQARLLRDGHYNVISMHDLSSRLEAGRPVEPKTVVITIDDGYEDFYTWAYPVLVKYRLPATIYVASDFIDGKLWLWPDIIEYILATAGRHQFSFQLGSTEKSYSLHSEALRHFAWSDIGRYCLTIPNQEKYALLQRLSENLEVQVPEIPVPAYSAMSWQQLREMRAHGIEIGGHTCTHPVLTSLPRAEAETEIRKSKARIEECLGCTTHSFAYPNGTRLDYDEEIKAMVRAVGYRSAVVAFADALVVADIFELRRYPVGTNHEQFRKVICGFEYLHMCLSNRRSKLAWLRSPARTQEHLGADFGKPESTEHNGTIHERSV